MTDEEQRRAEAFASKEDTNRAIHAMLTGLREQGEPTINAVCALSELLDRWMIVLSVDASKTSPDGHAETVKLCESIVDTLRDRIIDIKRKPTDAARCASGR